MYVAQAVPECGCVAGACLFLPLGPLSISLMVVGLQQGPVTALSSPCLFLAPGGCWGLESAVPAWGVQGSAAAPPLPGPQPPARGHHGGSTGLAHRVRWNQPGGWHPCRWISGSRQQGTTAQSVCQFGFALCDALSRGHEGTLCFIAGVLLLCQRGPVLSSREQTLQDWPARTWACLRVGRGSIYKVRRLSPGVPCRVLRQKL